MFRIAAAAALSLAASDCARAEDSAWEPAKVGMIECFAADLDNKTCQGMTAYQWKDGDNVIGSARFYNEAAVPGAVITTRWPATIKGNRNCSMITQDYAMTATFEEAGKPVSEEKTMKYRKILAASLREITGKTVCARIGKYGRDYTVQITVDGREMPSSSNWLAFVDKNAGFTLKP